MVDRTIARRDETTTHGDERSASAFKASIRLLTASSNAGGRSRKETATSAKTYAGGRPASQGLSSSQKRSGAEVRMSNERPVSATARATAAATIGQAGFGSRAILSSPDALDAHRRSSGAASRSFPPGCSSQLLAAQRTSSVETVHRPLEAGVERHLQRGGDSVDDARQPRGLRFREPAEHMAAPGRRSLARGLADTDAKAHEVGRAERADDREDAVVARARSAAPDADPAQGQVELVVRHPELLRGELRVAKRLRHRLPREVHVRLRQHEPDPSRLGAADQRLPAFAVDLHVHAARKLPYAREPEVVARVGIVRLRIAQPDDQPLFFSLFHAGAVRPAASAAHPLLECTQTRPISYQA